jgi:2-oxoglutarate ferredoxin oxidoreductase subunit alpha
VKFSVLIGGRAGQGINTVAEIITSVMTSQGYFVFNYRDYQSLIRGGHNFNILSISDKPVNSIESKVDTIIALDEKTEELHKKELNKNGKIIKDTFQDLGKNSNLANAAAYLRTLGIEKDVILKEIKKQFSSKESEEAIEKGFDSQESKEKLKPLKNSIEVLSGSESVAIGAVNSGIQFYFGYPMTPSTGLLNAMLVRQNEKLHVFQAENEISVVNMALGTSFSGKKVMVGTAGGGFDLMTEGLSFQGMSEIPLTVYLASRPGPGTGVPTYSNQADLDIALRAGHGEFPRTVIAPGDPIEAIENTNEAIYLAEKFDSLSIILSDKNLAENLYSTKEKPNKTLQIKSNRKIPGKDFVKASSYEHDKYGNTTESAELTKTNAENRIKKYLAMKKECEKFEMIKLHGNKKSKNLIIGFGSTKGVILDAIENMDAKFLQVIYMKPLSDKIKKEMQDAKKIILIEENSTGQLGRLLREKTGISIPEKNRILKYDGRPFYLDELKKELEKRLK